MSAYIEVLIKGDHRAYIEAGSVVGVISSAGIDRDTAASNETPMTVIIRGGDQIEGVYGISASRLILYVAGARHIMRNRKRIALLVAIEHREEFEAEIAVAASASAVGFDDDGGAS